MINQSIQTVDIIHRIKMMEQAKEWIRETFDLIEKYFWLEDKAKRIAEVMTKCHEELNNQIWKYFVDHQSIWNLV